MKQLLIALLGAIVMGAVAPAQAADFTLHSTDIMRGAPISEAQY
ncbi:MAG: hypothetical protein P8O97_01245 [Gammaproteobacteria bacterium]|nr:hypothetical protein [Gammaproteobacteria bacterium]